eukprot:TRINITY_DN46362_c0_g1_i1.p1 TRINITY_DN46362_c0_g1~~TRINITY_DN46362_c0_g1_i1.p1  ORF type:complete len:238 (+),score=42.99 TRINITY_DN46362_c0_g1_i1:128-841(+)
MGRNLKRRTAARAAGEEGLESERPARGAGAVTAPLGTAAGDGPPRRILLLRHGQGVHNLTGEDVRDAPLTEAGREQASSWRKHIGELGANVVLVSPLSRAVETACLAYADEPGVPLELCRPARELWWNELTNTPSTVDEMQAFLRKLPRGAEVTGLDEALCPGPDDPASESESIAALRAVLAMRSEETVAVACHWGVIHSLCSASAGNCDILECEYKKSGGLKVVKHHRPPGGPRTS